MMRRRSKGEDEEEPPSRLAEHQLAERLAADCNYPCAEDLQLAKHDPSDWLGTMLLERVCQHYQYENNRASLVEALLDERANPHILVKLLRVVALGKPIGLPAVERADSKAVGMNFLTHL